MHLRSDHNKVRRGEYTSKKSRLSRQLHFELLETRALLEVAGSVKTETVLV
jgi:hypothetical protein